MKKVSISAKVTKIVFGGMVVVPSACLRKENTTKSLRKDVATNTMLGAKASMVNTIITLSTVTSCCGLSGALRLRLTVGTVT